MLRLQPPQQWGEPSCDLSLTLFFLLEFLVKEVNGLWAANRSVVHSVGLFWFIEITGIITPGCVCSRFLHLFKVVITVVKNSAGADVVVPGP